MESLGARTAIAPAVVRVQAKNVKPLRGSAASRVRAVLNKDQDKSADDRAKSAVAGASRTGAESGKIGARAASARARRGRSARFEHPGRSDRVSRVAACALETPAAPPPVARTARYFVILRSLCLAFAIEYRMKSTRCRASDTFPRAIEYTQS